MSKKFSKYVIKKRKKYSIFFILRFDIAQKKEIFFTF